MGMSANQGLHLAAQADLAQARSLRMQASQCKSQSEAKIMISRAKQLEQNAKRLEKEYLSSVAKSKKK